MELEQKLIDEFIQYLESWNRVHKLTNYKSRKDIYRNIEDSLTPLEFLKLEKIESALDIGSGAGFPAIFLALALPNVQFRLCEPLIKKFSFLSFIKVKLKLNNVTIEKIRVQDLESLGFDLITSRAVTDTKTLLKLAKSHIKPQSQILLYKGSSEEVDENFESFRVGNRTYLKIEGAKCFSKF